MNRGPEPNVRDPSLIPLPKNRRPFRESGEAEQAAGKPLKILVSFGAEDPAGLGPLVYRALAAGYGGQAGYSSQAGNTAGGIELDLIPGELHRDPAALPGELPPNPVDIPSGLHRSPAARPGELSPSPADIPGGLHRDSTARPGELPPSPVDIPGGARRPGPADSASGGFLPQDQTSTPSGFRVLEPFPNLGEHLAGYDLLITHFGLTAFEALYAGTPVLLVSPGPFHEKLAKQAVFFSAGIGPKGARRAASLVRQAGGSLNRLFPAALSPEKTATRHGLHKPQERTLAGLLGNLAPLVSPECPACGSVPAGLPAGDRAVPSGTLVPALARFPRRTYRRCPRCGVVYMERLDPPPVEYGRDYFFDCYRRQYGKTYIEDFPGLVAAGKERLNRIQALAGGTSPPAPGSPGGKRLLDIGCAYGPFLAAAKEAGFSPLGIDPAEDAVRYVRETLKLEALQGFFPETPIPGEKQDHGFDVITLWYVIEHFRDPRRVLGEIRRLLKPGGTLAFSTPSLSGVSGRKNRTAFLEKSPADHWTLWSPRSCGRILKQAGFRLRRVQVTGHHPERFPLAGRFARRGGVLYAALFLLSRIFRLGDTFEAYATALPENSRKG
jgi:2-polyprenyl-3-methyl-5-hydroxy-6-metoxy-1,4-benzoquinol methylase